MRLTDKCWRLGRNTGIYEGTLSEFTRGDNTTEEIFLTESEAWEAEARRCAREAENAERSAANWRGLEAKAIANSRALSEKP